MKRKQESSSFLKKRTKKLFRLQNLRMATGHPAPDRTAILVEAGKQSPPHCHARRRPGIHDFIAPDQPRRRHAQMNKSLFASFSSEKEDSSLGFHHAR
jgi:hypothetical protein